jgi:alpha,alpha-trehalase
MRPDDSAPDSGRGRVVIDARRFDAIVFDMDGVITDTARVHFAAWKRLFDDWLSDSAPDGVDRRPFDEDDYLRHVDGRSRLDGITGFLESRGTALPLGAPGDGDDAGTVWALAGRKNGFFLEALASEGASPFESTLDVARAARRAGLRTAVVTASRNRAEVLAAAGADHLFDEHVDGIDAADLGLPGKPDPALFIEAASRLGASPGRTVVFEDALAGVEAGRRGGFGLTVGVDRSGGREAEFVARGADRVIAGLDAVDVVARGEAS